MESHNAARLPAVRCGNFLGRAIQERFGSDSRAIRIPRGDSARLAYGFRSDSSATTSPLYNIRCISKRGWAPFCIRRTAGDCESLELYGAVHEDCDGGGRRRAVTRHTAPPGRRAVRRPPTANGTSTAPPDGGAVEVRLAVGGRRTARRPPSRPSAPAPSTVSPPAEPIQTKEDKPESPHPRS